ncbi:hypothetical protein BGX31_006364, partial [Mortierella sp. GBA43]
MVFGGIVSSPRGSLAPHQALRLARVYMENAYKEQDADVILVLCHDVEVSLSQAKKGIRHSDSQALNDGIATAYIDLGNLLHSRGHQHEAKLSYKKAEKLGARVSEPGPRQVAPSPSQRTLTQPNPVRPNSVQPYPAQSNGTPVMPKNQVGTPVSILAIRPTANQQKRPLDIAVIPSHIFPKNVSPPSSNYKLPEADEHLISTPQLVTCLSLMRISQSPGIEMDSTTRSWIQAIEKDTDEQERLTIMATDVVRAFKRDELKDAKAVAEVVSLTPVLDKDTFRDLLSEFYTGVNQSGLLDHHSLEGLAQLVQGADPGYLDADDLVKILQLLSTRLKETHGQSLNHKYLLTLTVSHVLDAMADTSVKNLDREKLHAPLLSYLDGLKGSSDPYLVYQAAYAYQALLCVPDNETAWQAAMRRTGKVVKGVSGL